MASGNSQAPSAPDASWVTTREPRGPTATPAAAAPKAALTAAAAAAAASAREALAPAAAAAVAAPAPAVAAPAAAAPAAAAVPSAPEARSPQPAALTPATNWVFACMTEKQWLALDWRSPPVFTADMNIVFFKSVHGAVCHAIQETSEETTGELKGLLKQQKRSTPKRRASSSASGMCVAEDVLVSSDHTEISDDPLETPADPDAKATDILAKLLTQRWVLLRAPYYKDQFIFHCPAGSTCPFCALQDSDYIAVNPRSQYTFLGLLAGPIPGEAEQEWGLVTAVAALSNQRRCQRIAAAKQAALAARLQDVDDEITDLESRLQAAKRRRLVAQLSQ